MRVLVIEDSATYRHVVTGIFESIDLLTDAVETAEEGLERIERDDYDIVCVDLHLPEMDGMAFCRRLRQLEKGSLLPVILLTSDTSDTLQKHAFEAGITEVLYKAAPEPLHAALDAFIARIRRKLSGRVLYVDDNEVTAAATSHFLREAGLEVEHHCSADRALVSFHKTDFDLVISDVVVEGKLSGIGLLRTIRARGDARSETPFLAVSVTSNEQTKISILRQGADDFITRPVIPEEMLARIDNLIARKKLFDQVHRQQKKLRRMAITDCLTGLYNKGFLEETGRKMLSNARRHGYPLSILVLDLDHFKQINDNHGHDTGDQVLKAVGTLLKSCNREGDLTARFGGEEFVIVLPHCSLEDARAKAENLRTAIESLQPAQLTVTTSIGITCTGDDPETDFPTLFRQADEAAYAAKAGGRNCVEIYPLPLSDTA